MTRFEIAGGGSGPCHWLLRLDQRVVARSTGTFTAPAHALLNIHLLRAGTARFRRRHAKEWAGGFCWLLTIDGDEVARAAEHFPDRRSCEAAYLAFVQALADAAVPSLEPGRPAPPLPPPVVSRLHETRRSLFEGPRARQRGTSPDAIRPHRIAILHGAVTAGTPPSPLADVTVSVVGHPELGTTQTASDGRFTMAANGGDLLTIELTKTGFLPSRRTAAAPWEGHAHLPLVVLRPARPAVTAAIALGTRGAASVQVARAEPTPKDDCPQRTPMLVFPEGLKVVASGHGTAVPDSLSLAMTEYTAGTDGPQAMPAPLPPSSGYTYAVELSAAGADRLTFDRPVFHYVENFLNFPVGSSVPAGYFDPASNTWLSSENGRVIQLLSDADGVAAVDVDGKGRPAGPNRLAALGFTEGERRQLATAYRPGQQLWRVPLTHFSAWDLNWPYGPPAGATPPEVPAPRDGEGEGADESPDEECGSAIRIQSQVLGQGIPISGSPFVLCYASDRVPGRSVPFSLDVPLSGPTPPKPLKSIELDLTIAGQRLEQQFAARPNQQFRFTWDGRDDDGLVLQGRQPITARIGYVYDAVYQSVDEREKAFAQYSGQATQNQARREITLWQEWQGALGIWDARGCGLGGWSLDRHHTFDPVGHVLYCGNGRRRQIHADAGSAAICALISPRDAVIPLDAVMSGIAVAADGTIYVSSTTGIYKVGATAELFHHYPPMLNFSSPAGLAVGPDGAVYVADQGFHWVTRISADGTLTHVAGRLAAVPEAGFSGDGGPAGTARLNGPQGIAVATDGTIYLADTNNHRIRRVTIDGIITTVAGNGSDSTSGDGRAATGAGVASPLDVAVGRDGCLYIAQGDGFVRRVAPDGIISSLCGPTESDESSGNSAPFTRGPASALRPSSVTGVAVSPDGALIVSVWEGDLHRVFRITPDGMAAPLAGGGRRNPNAEERPATDAGFSYLDKVAVAADGSVLAVVGQPIGARRAGFIARIRPPYETGNLGELVIHSDQAAELYVFDSRGQHLRTLDAISGVELLVFHYDAQGLVTSVTCNQQELLRINRGNGRQVTLVSGNQQTTLAIGDAGYLAEISNGSLAFTFAYDAGGLLQAFTPPSGATSRYEYDADGRLERAASGHGPSTHLVREVQPGGFEVRVLRDTSPLFREQVFSVSHDGAGTLTRRRRCCASLEELTVRPDGRRVVTLPDGTIVTETVQADPLFSMYVPLFRSRVVRTPAGVELRMTLTRTVLGKPASVRRPSYFDRFTIGEQTYGCHVDTAGGAIAFGLLDDPDATTLKEREVLRRTRFNDGNQPVSIETKGWPARQWRYDTAGRVIETRVATDPPATFTIRYDANGQLIAASGPMHTGATFSFDPQHRRGTSTLPGAGEKLDLEIEFSPDGRLRALRSPAGPVHLIEHDLQARRLHYAPPAIAASPASGRGVSWQLDLGGQVQTVDFAGSLVEFKRDEGGRLILVKGFNDSTTLDYDRRTGQLTRLVSPSIAVDYAYDGRLCLESRTTGPINGTVKHVYGDGFQLSEETAGLGAITFAFDAHGQTNQAGPLHVGRDEGRRITSLEVNGQTLTFQYDAHGRPIGQKLADGFAARHTLDALGRIVATDESGEGVKRTVRYAYDQAGRLVKQTIGPRVIEYAYDANGNRTARRDGTHTLAATYDPQDRLRSHGDLTVVYDDAGMLREKRRGAAKVQRFEFGLHGALARATGPAGETVEYLNDGFGRRVAVRVDGALTRGFLYHRSAFPVAEVDAKGKATSHFVYATHRHVPDLIVQRRTTLLLIKDASGSVRRVVDTATGEVVQRLEYDAFGMVLEDTRPGFQPFGFAGGLYDDRTGLTRCGCRDYDAEVGRWTAKDPILFAAGDVNLYAYCGNDPVNAYDPLGLACATCSHTPYWGAGVGDYICRSGRDQEIPPYVLEQIEQLYRDGAALGPSGSDPGVIHSTPGQVFHGRIGAHAPWAWVLYPDVSAGMGGWYFRQSQRPGHGGHVELYDNYNFNAWYNFYGWFIPGVPYDRYACWTCYCKTPSCPPERWEKPMP